MTIKLYIYCIASLTVCHRLLVVSVVTSTLYKICIFSCIQTLRARDTYICLYHCRFYGLTIQIICDRLIDTDHIIWSEFIARAHTYQCHCNKFIDAGIPFSCRMKICFNVCTLFSTEIFQLHHSVYKCFLVPFQVAQKTKWLRRWQFAVERVLLC